MASPPTIQRASQGVAGAIALGILGVLICLESGLILRALMRVPPAAERRPSSTTSAPDARPAPLAPALPQQTPQPLVTISPPPVGQLTAPPPPVPTPAVAAPTAGLGPPPIGSFQMPSQPVSGIPAPAVPGVAPSTAPAAPRPKATPQPAAAMKAAGSKPADPAEDMTLAEMIDLAKQVRSLGDMQGALEVLKRADLRFPSAPEVLAETGQSYEIMGLGERAASFWKQLAAMDAGRAGGYGDLARRKLNISDDGTTPGSAPAPDFSGDFGPKVLSLGACTATRDTGTVNGEKVVLRIPVLRRGSAAIDPAQVDIDVYFFDRVNGEKIAQTIADEPLSAWGAPPVDWSGIGEEPLEVTYFLPTLTPGEVAAHGRRAYHGYVLRLYYQHKLQDAVAEPRDLLDFGTTAPQGSPAGGMNPLLPPVSN